MRQKPLEDLRLPGELLVALGGLLCLVNAALHHFNVGHHQLQIDDVDVPKGIGTALHMGDVAVLKAPHHMDDGVGGADVAQELVAQTLALGGALHQTGDVHEFDDGGGKLLGIVHIPEPLQPLVGNGHHAHVGVYGAEGIVGGFGTGVGDCVEQGALAHVGQTHDS